MPAFPGAALRCRTDASVALQEPQTRFVIDASVVIPWYLEQNLTPISMLFLQRLEHCQAPGVISAHVSQVLWSYCQEDLLSGTVGAAALRLGLARLARRGGGGDGGWCATLGLR